MGRTCHSEMSQLPEMTERGDRVRVTSRPGSAWRFVGDLKKVRELNTRRGGSTFGDELAPYRGRSRWGPNE